MSGKQLYVELWGQFVHDTKTLANQVINKIFHKKNSDLVQPKDVDEHQCNHNQQEQEQGQEQECSPRLKQKQHPQHIHFARSFSFMSSAPPTCSSMMGAQTPLDYAYEMASKFETLWEAQLALGEIPSILVPGNILEHCESDSEPESGSIFSRYSSLQSSHHCIAPSPTSSEPMYKSEAATEEEEEEEEKEKVEEEEEEEEEVLLRRRRSIPQQHEQSQLQRPCIQSQLSFNHQTLTEKFQENTVPLSTVARLSPSPSFCSVTPSLSSSKRRPSSENSDYSHERKDSGVFVHDNQDSIIIKLINEINGAESNFETEAVTVPTLDKDGEKELVEGVEAEPKSDHITLRSKTMSSSSYYSRSNCDDAEHMSESPTSLTSVS